MIGVKRNRGQAKFWRFSVSAALWISPPTHPLLSLRELVFGRTARGAPSDPPLDRRTGQGRVDAKPGDYSDAIAKGNSVHLLATESTGAVSLRCLAPADPAAQGPCQAVVRRQRLHLLRPGPRLPSLVLSPPRCSSGRCLRSAATSLLLCPSPICLRPRRGRGCTADSGGDDDAGAPAASRPPLARRCHRGGRICIEQL